MEWVVETVHLLALVCTNRAVTNYSDAHLLLRPEKRVVRVAICRNIVPDLPLEKTDCGRTACTWSKKTVVLACRDRSPLARVHRAADSFVSLAAFWRISGKQLRTFSAQTRTRHIDSSLLRFGRGSVANPVGKSVRDESGRPPCWACFA